MAEIDNHKNYTAREVLATFRQHDGVEVEIVRYTWRAELARQYGYSTCIRMRRHWHEMEFLEREEALGVPEIDWMAFVEVLKSVNL